mmetsp:Transcript_41448/g.67251  ORF Transcript_41448/g.67251 Transcript_41448/m.67251 type:complete len:225 (+) Transcript_41448:171-845(+)|eukprot:CAMPEP_0184658110 /NCGR_PEP_ID=MMETSP0308-20130426/23558_1 /TAXON_ID=38269 /ORGANISM="Gloeochaete witrockiana, Strain SAG 46.84" /LENGTH=224 /DNA_ID=CAMNT_0027096747 /DNA_START=91 /DNA_END=765 /DNA_ORIENTATION=+
MAKSTSEIEDLFLSIEPHAYSFGSWVHLRRGPRSKTFVRRFLVLKRTYLAAYEGPDGVEMTASNAHLFMLDREWITANGGYTSVKGSSVSARQSSVIVSRTFSRKPMHIELSSDSVGTKNQWKNALCKAIDHCKTGILDDPKESDLLVASQPEQKMLSIKKKTLTLKEPNPSFLFEVDDQKKAVSPHAFWSLSKLSPHMGGENAMTFVCDGVEMETTTSMTTSA